MGDDGNIAKKNRAEGSSSFTQMHTTGGSQSHHSGRIIRNKKVGHKYRIKGFRLGYGSSSGQSLGYSSSGFGSGSSLVPCTQCGKSHMGPCLISSGGCFRCGQQGHFARECPMISKHIMGLQGSIGNMARQMHPGTSSMASSQYSGQ
ncbi:uncharacterized protein LOC131176793 [Hevea brasiliensis]|uniref:uncharacterized protein LOC131176793 n=1 Tax=Hevea brasiliensis TaxID=3981 RepID=UPI0025E06217|nr:uncharacterized protein LOC131176793 [Hevea brasiliensis]